MTDFESIHNSYARHLEALAKANALNRAIVFDALAVAGITNVIVAFDGEGDSGQIEGITALAGTEPRVLPKTTLTIRTARWNSDELRSRDITLAEAIEALCYSYLEHEHGGWENNDGAYGEFRFDVRDRTIALEFNGRFTDVHTETIFGATITLSSGRVIPVRWIGEQHVREDLGFIPGFADWMKAIRPESWMGRAARIEPERDEVTRSI